MMDVNGCYDGCHKCRGPVGSNLHTSFKVNVMKFFRLSLSTMMLRYYLMMAVIIVAGFTHVWVLAFLALPIFLSCLMGVRMTLGEIQASTKALSRVMHFGHKEEAKSAA